MKLRVEDLQIEPVRRNNRVEFQFTAPDDLGYVTLEKDDYFGDLKLEEIQLEQSAVSTYFVEPMESETVESGLFKSVRGIEYEITNPNSDTWSEIIKTSEYSLQTYHSGTLQSTLAQTAEDVVFGVRDIVSGDQSSFNLRLDGIETRVKNEMFNSVRTQLVDFIGVEISDLEGNYNTIVDTVNNHTRTIGDSGGNLTQMVMSDELFQLNVIDEIKDTQSSYTQMVDMIGLRASGNSITIGGDGIIIDAKSIYLGDSTQIDDGVITNRMIAIDASLDGAKIKNATIASAKIANLDANKITTGTIKGIRAELDVGLIGGWDMEAGGLYKSTPYGYTTIKPGGDVAIGIGSPQHAHTTGATLQIWHDGMLRFDGGMGIIEAKTISNTLRLYGYNKLDLEAGSEITMRGNVVPRDSAIATNLGTHASPWYNMHALSHRVPSIGVVQQESTNSHAYNANSLEVYTQGNLFLKTAGRQIYAQGSIYPYYESNSYDIGGSNWRFQRLFITSQPNVSSDGRYKDNIQDIPDELMNNLKEIKPRMYEFKGEWHFGYIAQDVERAIYKYVTSFKKWACMEEMNEYARSFAVLHKSESKMSLLYGEIAVLKDAEYNERITKLENKMEELLNAN